MPRNDRRKRLTTPSVRIPVATFVLAVSSIITQQAIAGSVLVSLTRDQEQLGYNQQLWTSMTADMNAAATGGITTATSLSNLNQLLTYDGIWVDLREQSGGAFTATEASNLSTYISTGRRVVLIGENPAFSGWDNSILSAVGGAYSGDSFNGASPTHAFVPLTSGVNSLMVANGSIAPGGTTLFTDHVATVWGPARNAVVVLDSNAFDDDHLKIAGNSNFAKNIAGWIAGKVADAPLIWSSPFGGSWQSGSAWSDGAMPSCADDAVFNMAADAQSAPGYTVSISSAVTAQNVYVTSDRVTLQVAAGNSVAVGNSIAVGQTAGKAGYLTFARSGTSAAATVSTQTLAIGAANSTVGNVSVGPDVNLVVNGSTTISGDGSFDVAGLATLAAVDGDGSITVENSGSVAAQHIRGVSLGISGSVAIQQQGLPRNNANTVSILSSLTFGAANATFDLNDNDLIVKGGDIVSISNQIKTGLNLSAGGYWNGHGITSGAAAANPSHLTTIGAIQNNDGSNHIIYGSGASLGLFDGQDSTLNDILIKYTYFGDADLSGHVDGSDYAKIDNGFAHHLGGWFNGDFNYDGVVDGSDYSLIDNAFNSQGLSLSDDTASAIASNSIVPSQSNVPEPTSFFAIVTVIGCDALRSRVRRRLRRRTV